MKAATPKTAEGSSPAKKVVRRVVSKGGVPPVLKTSIIGPVKQRPISKKDDSPGPPLNQIKPAGIKLDEVDSCLESNTEATNVQDNSKLDGASNKVVKKIGVDENATNPRNTEEKPKTKKIVVKKKVIVVKKSAASGVSSTSESASTFNPVTTGEENNKTGLTQRHTTSEGMSSENSAGTEAKPNILTSEKPKKVIKKVIVRKKGGSTMLNEEKMQNLETNTGKKDDQVPLQKVDGSVKMDTSKSLTQEASPQIGSPNKVVVDEDDEREGVAPSAEELPFDDNHDVKEESRKQEDVAEEQNIGVGIAPTRSLSERQKRKKLEVFVGGLDKDATEDDLRAAFQQVGDVLEVRLMMNPVTGKNKGYAFVRFASPDQAVLAATEFSVMKIRGKECGVLPNQDNDTLFIGKISRDWKSSEVVQKLKEYGVNGIEELTLIGDPHNEALNRGYAFLELATHYDALNAFQRLQRPGVTFGYDRPAKIAWAQPLAEVDASSMSQVKSVFVDGLPPHWTEDMVKQNFGKFGEIERVIFARNMPFAKRKDFSFIYFSNRENALACIQAYSNAELSDGDKKVKVKVSLTRPLNKGKFEKPFRYSSHPGHGRGRGRGEGWYSPHFGERVGRGFGRIGSGGTMPRAGKRLYDEDEVRMLLKAAREQQDWPSGGRGGRFGRASRVITREPQYFDAEQMGSSRQEEESIYPHDTYSRPPPSLETLRGNVSKPISIRDTYEPHHPGASRGRGSHHVSPHHDAPSHHVYDQSPVYGGDEGAFASGIQDYHEMVVGMKRTASAWDEDNYETSHRGYPRARIDYTDNPEVAPHYADHSRSPVGPVTQTIGVRQRSTREGPMPFYIESGSGPGKSGPTYEHSYNSIPPDTSTYPLETSERRETSMYSSSLYGGHGTSVGYDFHSSGFY